jgi:hypothetical protein
MMKGTRMATADGHVGRAHQRPLEARRIGWGALALTFVILALVMRLHSFVYSVFNYDESLYILMGSELAKGNLPYTTLCDLKPFGLFALFAVFTALPVDGVLASRLAAALVVGLTAFLICRIAALLFDDEDRSIGLAAGLGYVTFSTATGGIAAQGEIFHNAFAALAAFMLLREAARPMGPSWGTFALAGLSLGIGIQVKQSVIFDTAALAIGILIVRAPLRREMPRLLRSLAPRYVLLALAAAVPTLAVIGAYAATGQLDAWIAGNITAHRVFYGLERPFELHPALWTVWEQAPLWAGATGALVAAPRLVVAPHETRSLLFLALWVLSIVVCQIFLRIASDHYFLQFLPSLTLLAGFALGRGILAVLSEGARRLVLLGAVAALSLYAVAKYPLIHSAYILAERWTTSDRNAGDTPRRIAADVNPKLRPGDALYVIGFQPIVYFLTQASIPTRFAFTGLPSRDIPGRDGCPWVDQATEMKRILDTRPRFIVVEDGIFVHELRPPVKSHLTAALATEYRHVRRYDVHYLHGLFPFERAVMNGGAAADLYELKAS